MLNDGMSTTVIPSYIRIEWRRCRRVSNARMAMHDVEVRDSFADIGELYVTFVPRLQNEKTAYIMRIDRNAKSNELGENGKTAKVKVKGHQETHDGLY